jgi:hypothetical protein
MKTILSTELCKYASCVLLQPGHALDGILQMNESFTIIYGTTVKSQLGLAKFLESFQKLHKFKQDLKIP